MIDGLDECGSPYDADRKRLIKAVAGLHGSEENFIRTLVFSRKESDIENEFGRMRFHTVSIAATSADLRLFANAWSEELDVRSDRLRSDIVDTLVDEAQGMFMWVRAQVDYLRRLPNDVEKRKALKRLPPDLPQTYVRILETIDSTYPKQTTVYIQRLLKWIIHDSTMPFYDWAFEVPRMRATFDILCEAICVEDEDSWPTVDSIPTRDQVSRWLGCLIRVDDSHGSVPLLSHFTIKEFLSMDAELVSSHVARQYLTGPKDRDYIVKVYLTYVMHSHFKNIVVTSYDDADRFLSKSPFYCYVVHTLLHTLRGFRTSVAKTNDLIKKFFSMPPRREFELWARCYTWLADGPKATSDNRLLTPLHFACVSGLSDQVELLLNQGVNPNATDKPNSLETLPIHLASIAGYDNVVGVRMDGVWLDTLDLREILQEIEAAREQPDIQMTRALVDSGADVNRQARATLYGQGRHVCVVTPLVLALFVGNWSIAGLLLRTGANWDATADDCAEREADICSVERLLDLIPDREHTARLAAELDGDGRLMKTLEEWRLPQTLDDLDNDPDLQEKFVNAFSTQDWQKVRDLLIKHPSLDVDSKNERGKTAVHHASSFEGDVLSILLERGANPDLVSHDDRLTALCVASLEGFLENIKLLLRSGANIEHRMAGGWTPLLLATGARQNDAVRLLLDEGADANATSNTGEAALYLAAWQNDVTSSSLLLAKGASTEHRGAGGWTPLLVAVHRQHNDEVQLLLGLGADINAALNCGAGAMHLAIIKYGETVFDSLLTRGLKSLSPDNYGTTPLHLACMRGLRVLVQRLLVLSTELSESVNADSSYFGTPLYIAAVEGYDPVVRLLLDHGALIDKSGRGNLLGPALMAACAEGHSEVVQTLLSRGAALEVEGSRFKSAEGTARAFRQEAILRILEEHEGRSSREAGEDFVDRSTIAVDDRGGSCTEETEEIGDEATDTGQRVMSLTIRSEAVGV
ncbi:MAG: hypothetical protein Q9193_005342 [Seirophora villosa]